MSNTLNVKGFQDGNHNVRMSKRRIIEQVEKYACEERALQESSGRILQVQTSTSSSCSK